MSTARRPGEMLSKLYPLILPLWQFFCSVYSVMTDVTCWIAFCPTRCFTSKMAGIKKAAGPSSERVAANIRRIRRDRELTTAALSQRLTEIGHPIADTGITKIEKGTRRVDVEDLMALALALDVTPNLLLLPEVDFKNPRETFALTPGGDKVRADAAWAWAYGERPLGHKATSYADQEPARAELEFIAQNRRYYARGGFGWLGSVSSWLEDADKEGPGKPQNVSAKVEGSGLIAGAILGAFTRYALDTKDIRAAAESAVMATLVEEEPGEMERGLSEVWAWLASLAPENEDKEG
jgi:transcriptional regulator with XRE-family HTH domain